MSDLNDLNKPTPTDTEPNVLDTLRAHIIRAATWSGWGATGNKVAGIMSAVTAAVSGGRSLRLYRRNDANTSDEEIVSLPGVSIGGNAASATTAAACTGNAASASSVAWSGVSGKPTTVAGYGITDMGSQSVNYASGAGSVAWSGVSGKPTTVAGYGITDMGSQSVNYASSAGSVAWSGVSGRPTAVSAFANDAGYLTSATAPTPNTTNVLAATAGAAVGAVGSYAFLVTYPNPIVVAPGTTIAGSNLRFAGINQFDGVTYITAPIPSGTWRCMGYLNSSSTATVAIFLRIS